MQKITKNWLWLGLFITLGLMVHMGCDSGPSADGCGTSDPIPTPTPPPQVKIFEGNYSITTLADLKAIAGYTEITGNLVIKSSSLANLNGLESLWMIDRDLIIDNNSVLENIDGLGNLSSIGGILEIVGNGVLANLNGLSNLQTIRLGAGNISFRIYCNPNLPVQEVNQLRNRLSQLGWSGCYYTAATCDPVNTVPHGWCPCSLLPFELAPGCWRIPYSVWIP